MPTYPVNSRLAALCNRLGAGLIAVLFALSAMPVLGGTYIVNNTTKLDDLSATLPGNGVHYVRFEGEGYQVPGSLTLTNNGCDTLVFERNASTDTGAILIQGTLMRIQGQRGTVILRGLAFKFENGGALFDINLGDNQNLVLDGCTFLGNAASTAKVLAWSGGGKVSLENCMFTNMGATAFTSANEISIVHSLFVATGPVQLTQTTSTGRVSLFNNLFNFPEVLSISMAGQLEMWFNTSNLTQLNLDGRSTGAFNIHNNYFANPPARNMVADAGEARYPFNVKPGSYKADKSLAVENARYPAWNGFTNPLSTSLFGVTNETIPAARDAAVTWDWRIPSETKYGAWNGNIPLPTFDLFPTDTSMNLPIPGGRATVLPAPFPRQARFSLKAIPQYYSTRVPDSVRSWFQKDTLLALDGKVAVLHLTLPNREDGTPVLVVPTWEGFRAGAPGPRGGTQYQNFQLKAQEFIPALGGQNTFTGKTVVSTDSLRPGIFLAFSSVTRAGMTTIGSTQLQYTNRKWRLPRHQGQVVAFSASSTAEVGETFHIGVPVAGTTVLRKDSLFFWRGGDVFLPVKDSGGKFMAAVPPPLGKMDAILIERMTFGPGADTLNLPKARFFAKSAAGYQLIAEPVPAPDDPYLGAFGAVLKLSWPGRLPGDSLYAQFPRTDIWHLVLIRRGNETVSLPLLPGDPGISRVALGIGDSNQVVFVARRFTIPAGSAVNRAIGRDSVLGLTSRRPGEIALDAGFRPTDLDTNRLSILAARRILLDSLIPQGTYTLSMEAKPAKTRELVRALVSINGIWQATAFRENGGRYAITMPAAASAVMMVEFASAADWAPDQPAATAAMSIQGDSLVFTPGLTPSERAALPLFRADLLSLGSDGNLRVESSRYGSVESSLSVGLAPDRLYAYRVVYRSPFDRFSPNLDWIPLAGKQPDLAAITARLPVRKAMFRHLVGFPFDGATLGANVKAGMVAGAGNILALDTIVSGKWAGLAVGDGTRLERGKGYLLGADQSFRVKAEGAVFAGLKPDTLRLNEPGWHLIANPLPFPFPRTALGIPDSTALSFPRALHRLDTTTGSPAVYDWPVPDTLQPFEGYLIYVFKPTYLAFDPYSAATRDGLDAASGAPSPVVAAVKRAAPKLSPSTSTPSALRMTLSGPGGSQSAVFFQSGPFLQTPYMRPFSEQGRVLEFRAGEGAGWAYRRVDRMDSLRIPIEVVAPEAGTYALNLSGGDAGGNGSGRFAALLDMGSGKIYHVAEMGALPLAAGRNAFVLLHGKAAAPGIADFSAGLPTEFALDQNTPNPFRGSTRIRFRVPGGPDGLFRGRFRVTSIDGRTIEARDLGALTVGEHSLTVDENGWRPGVYVYELRLESGSGSRTFRRRMVCGPMGG